MGIVDRALDAIGLQKKSISTSDPVLAAFLSGNSNNQVRQPYANIPPVYKAIKAVIDNLQQVSFKITDKSGAVVENKELSALFDSGIMDETGEQISFSDFVQRVGGYYCLYGENFIRRAILNQGQAAGTRLPDSLTVIDPREVSENSLGYNLVSWNRNGETIPKEQIIQVKDFNPYNMFRGLSPVKVILDQIKMETGASDLSISAFQNGVNPSLILETEKTLDDRQRDELRKAIAARHGGAKNAGKAALFEGGLKAKTIPANLQDYQLSDLMGKIEEMIIGTWRVPKAMFGYTDNLNRATFLGQLNVFWTMMLIPILRKHEQVINQKIVSPYTSGKQLFAFDLSNVEAMQDSIGDVASTIQVLTQSGFTRNEINARLKLGFDDVEWGNSWWIPFSMVEAGGGNISDVQPSETKSQKKTIIAENGLQYSERAYQFIKQFNKLHDSIHKRFKSDLRVYFNSQRKRMLDAFDDLNMKSVNKAVRIKFNIAKEIAYYEEATKQDYQLAIEQGVKNGESATGQKSSDQLKYKVSAATESRMQYIAHEIIGTTEDDLNKIISNGIADGKSGDDIKNDIKGYFNRIDNRAGTIARTEITAQLNAGLLMQYEDVGVKQKEWVTNIDGFERESHRDINGEVVRIDEKFSNGLMYPGDYGPPEETINCFIPETKVQGIFDLATKVLYSGKIIIINTAMGNSLSVTPNHPILTDKGWVKAKDINKTSNILSYSNVVDKTTMLSDVHYDNAVPTIRDVYDAILSYGARFRKMPCALDFDNDGKFFDGDIDIVSLNWKLLNRINSNPSQFGDNLALMPADPCLLLEKTDSPLNDNLSSVVASSSSCLSFNGLTFDKLGIELHKIPLDYFCFGLASRLDAVFSKDSVDNTSRDIMLFSKLLNANPGRIFIDKVVCCDTVDFSGHVYDLQSKDGYIVAENIIVSNCRCSALPVEA